MTAKGTTKQGMLDAALELFSVQGYEATSISQLAEAVGIRKASLYSHFENKQAILDALIQTTIGEYEKHSIFANADWDDPAFTKDKEHMTAEMAAQMFLGQIRYILHDPKICRASAFTTAIATAMMPEMNSVRTPVERNPSISFLTRQSMERYSPTPGTSGIMPGMTKMIAGILYIRASISETKDTVSAADRKPISSCPLSTNIIR